MQGLALCILVSSAAIAETIDGDSNPLGVALVLGPADAAAAADDEPSARFRYSSPAVMRDTVLRARWNETAASRRPALVEALAHLDAPPTGSREDPR